MQAARRHVNSLFGFISSIVPPIATVYNMLRCPADQREQDGRKDNVSICAWNEGHNRFRRRDCRESPCFPPYNVTVAEIIPSMLIFYFFSGQSVPGKITIQKSGLSFQAAVATDLPLFEHLSPLRSASEFPAFLHPIQRYDPHRI